ncbi:MAG: hypothetical protein JXR48_15375 [Candidatus Delongbacteria bacterium]|nr:hypothetical protein [Candidatus Delongbacteria bacterium]MBN2836336.1 hypothetical protein [Candidatus Delongbacteria bacterium]
MPSILKQDNTNKSELTLYYVFRDPISVENTNDIIGFTLKKDSAFAIAKRYSEKYGRTAIVGRLIKNITWH